jgi:hypothetical protein
MYFGLTNSPATFQTMMNEIFQDLITEGIMSIYLNDILIFTNSLEKHHQITCLVLDRMYKHKLNLWPENASLRGPGLNTSASLSRITRWKWIQ